MEWSRPCVIRRIANASCWTRHESALQLAFSAGWQSPPRSHIAVTPCVDSVHGVTHMHRNGVYEVRVFVCGACARARVCVGGGREEDS